MSWEFTFTISEVSILMVNNFKMLEPFKYILRFVYTRVKSKVSHSSILQYFDPLPYPNVTEFVK